MPPTGSTTPQGFRHREALTRGIRRNRLLRSPVSTRLVLACRIHGAPSDLPIRADRHASWLSTLFIRMAKREIRKAPLSTFEQCIAQGAKDLSIDLPRNELRIGLQDCIDE